MYLETIKNGQFICESIDFYSCSRCHRNELKTFIKYKDTILCLNCVDAISIDNKRKPPLTRMEQDFFKNREQDFFKNKEQDFFKNREQDFFKNREQDFFKNREQDFFKNNNTIKPNNSSLTRMMQNIFINDYPPNVDFKILEKLSDNEFRVVINNIVCIMTPIHIAREYFKYLSNEDKGYFFKYI
jgi:hypothetical protein